MRSFCLPECAIAAEHSPLVGDPQKRGPEAPTAERVREHRPPVPEHEPRAVPEDRPDVADLDPALGTPPQELDFLGVDVLAADHGGRAVILLQPLVDDEPAVAELLR